METKEQMENALKMAQSKSLVSKEEIGTACCYAVQDKFWVEDPDGIQWEVYYFHEDVEFNDPKFTEEQTASCCSPNMETIAEVSTSNVGFKQKVNLKDITNPSPETACKPGSGCC